MTITINVFYLLFWLLVSFSIAYLFFKKVRFFRKRFGYVILALAGLTSAVLHNIISTWFDYEEKAFFFLALVCLATAFFLFCFRIIHRGRRQDRIARGEE